MMSRERTFVASARRPPVVRSVWLVVRMSTPVVGGNGAPNGAKMACARSRPFTWRYAVKSTLSATGELMGPVEKPVLHFVKCCAGYVI